MRVTGYDESKGTENAWGMAAIPFGAFLLLFCSSAWPFGAPPANTPPAEPLEAGKQVWQRYQNGANTWAYLVWLPYDYDKDVNRKWPMIYFESCVSMNAGYGSFFSGNCSSITGYLGNSPDDYHFIADSFVVVTGYNWVDDFQMCPNPYTTAKDANYRAFYPPLFAHLQSSIRVDPARINVAAICCGTMHVMRFVMLNLFSPASMVLWEINDPSNGCTDTTKLDAFKNIPMYIMHGKNDQYIPSIRSKFIADKITACGNPNVTWILSNTGHESWFGEGSWPDGVYKNTYGDRDTMYYTWMLAQRTPAPTPAAAPSADRQDRANSDAGQLTTAGQLASSVSPTDRIEILDLHGKLLVSASGSQIGLMLPQLSRGVHLARLPGQSGSVVRVMVAK
jgi:hypothetical protein